MTYSLRISEDAEKEWNSLDATIKVQFKKKLKERLEHPRVEPSRLNGMRDLLQNKIA
jgi:mRNA interferase RelE/StbE